MKENVWVAEYWSKSGARWEMSSGHSGSNTIAIERGVPITLATALKVYHLRRHVKPRLRLRNIKTGQIIA